EEVEFDADERRRPLVVRLPRRGTGNRAVDARPDQLVVEAGGRAAEAGEGETAGSHTDSTQEGPAHSCQPRPCTIERRRRPSVSVRYVYPMRCHLASGSASS